jgi:hypothetical protein
MTSLERLTAAEAGEELSKISGKGKWKRRNKFNAIKTVLDGFRFDSKKEAECWSYLKKRERAGEIECLERQVKYELAAFAQTPDGVSYPAKVCVYKADFRYFDKARKEWVVADAKGVKTALFNLKMKLMRANHGIEVELM